MGPNDPWPWYLWACLVLSHSLSGLVPMSERVFEKSLWLIKVKKPFLESGEKEMLSCRGTMLSNIIPYIHQDIRKCSNELGYLAKEVFSHSIRGTTCFHLAAHSKVWSERETKRTLKLKKLGLNGDENTQILQWENDAKMQKLLLKNDQTQIKHARKTCTKGKAYGMTVKSCPASEKSKLGHRNIILSYNRACKG